MIYSEWLAKIIFLKKEIDLLVSCIKWIKKKKIPKGELRVKAQTRTIAWETECQIALRNRVRGKVSVFVILLKGKYMQLSTYFLAEVSDMLLKVTAIYEEQMSP